MMSMSSECSPVKPEHFADCGAEQLLGMFEMMTRIRLAEERIAELITDKEIICPCHLYIGQETIATGVCAALAREDVVFSTHRSHGHYLAKGGDLKGMMAEIYGRASGCSGGKGGSMHLAAPAIGFPGSSAIVAGTIPLAVGAALGFQLQQRSQVAVAFFGDGATNEGAFYESLNFASLKKLPVIFVCENNLYSTHMPIAAIQADTRIFQKASVFNLPGSRIDGNNLGEVYATAREAVLRAKGGGGPTLIECMTYRWRGHVGPKWDVDKGLRSQEEVDWWVGRCGMRRFEEYLLATKVLTAELRDTIVQRIGSEVEEALICAKESPFPDRDKLYEGVYKDGTRQPCVH
jgi:acetoin:2,6-dichlorophenolindophenol oxidoreductase subunit alpha